MDLETRGGIGEDATALDALVSDDMVLESSHPAEEVVFPSTKEEGLIVISDDEDIDHLHSSDDDEEDHNGVPKVKEMKPLVLPSGSVINVEKDYWKLEEEKRLKRIAQRAEREAKDKELQDAVANTSKTKVKMLRLQEESKAEIRMVQEQSQAQFSQLQSQMALLMQAMKSQSTPSQPPQSSAMVPVLDQLGNFVLGLLHPRAEDKAPGESVAADDIVSSTPACQLLNPASPPEGLHHRVDDAVGAEAEPAMETAKDIGRTSMASLAETHLPRSVDEEKVDYEVSEEEMEETGAEEQEGDSSSSQAVADCDQQAEKSSEVQPSDPYVFE